MLDGILVDSILASPLFVATFRDWVIIVAGIAIAGFFLIALLATAVLALLVRGLLKKTSALMDDNVKPLLSSMKESADNVRGTTTFITGAAATPVIRTYGVVAGVRRAAGVLAGLTGAGGDKPKP